MKTLHHQSTKLYNTNQTIKSTAHFTSPKYPLAKQKHERKPSRYDYKTPNKFMTSARELPRAVDKKKAKERENSNQLKSSMLK